MLFVTDVARIRASQVDTVYPGVLSDVLLCEPYEWTIEGDRAAEPSVEAALGCTRELGCCVPVGRASVNPESNKTWWSRVAGHDIEEGLVAAWDFPGCRNVFPLHLMFHQVQRKPGSEHAARIAFRFGGHLSIIDEVDSGRISVEYIVMDKHCAVHPAAY